MESGAWAAVSTKAVSGAAGHFNQVKLCVTEEEFCYLTGRPYPEGTCQCQ